MSTKDKILNSLKENLNNWISGEVLSNQLDVSRAAISKQINNLKKDGYTIESSTKKGYKLVKLSEFLLVNEIKENLKTNIFGQNNIFYYNNIDSTNNQAKLLASKGEPEGTIIVAEKQTTGKGRKGRSWISTSSDNIYISLILRPKLSPADSPIITLMTAVAIAEALLELSDLDIKIKWPNDILINKKKIAGILTEISTDMDYIDYIIVGLGLNVNSQISDFPDKLKEIATSLFVETKQSFSRSQVLKTFLYKFEKYYSLFKNKEFNKILSRWKELSNVMNKEVKVELFDKTIQGKVIDIDKKGALIVKDHENNIHDIFSGDVILL